MKLQLFAPEPYTNIKEMVRTYHKTMNIASNTLKNHPTESQLIITNDPIGYILTPDEFDDIKNQISLLDGFANYLFMFGIDPAGHVTICIVGADAKNNVLQVYKDFPGTFGQEKWPTLTKVTLSDTEASLSAFLEN